MMNVEWNLTSKKKKKKGKKKNGKENVFLSLPSSLKEEEKKKKKEKENQTLLDYLYLQYNLFFFSSFRMSKKESGNEKDWIFLSP